MMEQGHFFFYPCNIVMFGDVKPNAALLFVAELGDNEPNSGT
jgi:hypothetical protein